MTTTQEQVDLVEAAEARYRTAATAFLKAYRHAVEILTTEIRADEAKKVADALEVASLKQVATYRAFVEVLAVLAASVKG